MKLPALSRNSSSAAFASIDPTTFPASSDSLVHPVINGSPRYSGSNFFSGNFALIVPRDRQYSLSVESPGYLPYTGHLSLDMRDKTSEMAMKIMLDTAIVGATTTLANIFFGSDSATLKPESYFELDRLTSLLRRNPAWKISIQGFTDSTGSLEHNLILSKERARAVVSYLRMKGIAPDRLVAEGFGPNDAIASNATEEGRSQNRRVVFRLRAAGN